MTPLISYGISIITAFVLGFFIGTKTGKKQALQEQLMMQKKMEATKMWTDNLKKYMGGQNAKL